MFERVMIRHSGKPRRNSWPNVLSRHSVETSHTAGSKRNRPVDVGKKVREAGRGGVKATVPFSLLFLPPPIPHLSDQVFLGYCLTAIDAAGATLGGFQAGPSGALR